MKVTFEQVDSILKTLPTGYYLTRKADVQLTMGGETFAAVLDDKIFISYPTLALTLDRLPDDLDLETVEGCVRALLYHEVSHLFLSPTRLDMTKRVNVMEDERIETLLRKYYMKVNFKKFVILVNGGDGGDDRPENSFMAFYRLVRFRNYRWCAAKADERLAEVSRIIKDFADMGRTAGSYVCDRYVGRIDDLYKAVQRDMAEEEEKEKKAEEEKKDGEGKSDKSDGEGGDDSADSTGDSDGEKAGDKDSGKGKAGKDKKDSEGDKDGDDKAGKGSERSEGSADKEDGEEEGRDDAEGDGSDGEGDGDKEKEADGGDTGHTGAEGDKEGEKKDGSKSGKGGDEGDDESEGAGEGDGEGDSDKDTEKSRGGSPKGGRCGEPHDEDSEDDVDPTPDDATIDRKAVEELVTKLFSEYTMDVKTYARLERIFKAAEKKHSNHSAASNAYSGTLDPRQVAFRSDYRWWLHRNPQGEHRRFAKTHLTLFVDVSGSFSSSEGKLNALIKSLMAVKRSNKTFDFDVIAMGSTNRMFNPAEGKSIRCSEGNFFGNDVVTLARKCRRTDAENYQLAVFDGDAMSCDGMSSSNRSAWHRDHMAAWKVFDDPRTVIVTDEYNTCYLEKAKVTRPKVISVKSCYAEKFTENVIKLLEQVIGA